MPDRTRGMLVVAALGLGCGHPPQPAPAPIAAPAARHAEPSAAPEPSQDERLAAIQKAMNELDEAAQG